MPGKRTIKLEEIYGLISEQKKQIDSINGKLSVLRDSFAKIVATRASQSSNADLQRVGTIIQEYRVKRKLSQQDLAILANTSQKTISLLEMGKVPNPRASTLTHLFNALDIPVDELASGIWFEEKNTA